MFSSFYDFNKALFRYCHTEGILLRVCIILQYGCGCGLLLLRGSSSKYFSTKSTKRVLFHFYCYIASVPRGNCKSIDTHLRIVLAQRYHCCIDLNYKYCILYMIEKMHSSLSDAK